VFGITVRLVYARCFAFSKSTQFKKNEFVPVIKTEKVGNNKKNPGPEMLYFF
jgi:hypothetical protein